MTTRTESTANPAWRGVSDHDINMFALFWAQYPWKKGKQAARVSWAKLIKWAPVDEIMEGLQSAVKYWDWQKLESPDEVKSDGRWKYTPMASTWLNQGRHEDEYEEPPERTGLGGGMEVLN